jgi:hypothetical protein
MQAKTAKTEQKPTRRFSLAFHLASLDSFDVGGGGIPKCGYIPGQESNEKLYCSAFNCHGLGSFNRSSGLG